MYAPKDTDVTFNIQPMPLAHDTLKNLLLTSFPDADITITDLAGDDDHWAVAIKSNHFKGKSRIQQHKMVYQALQGNMGEALHALQLKTYS